MLRFKESKKRKIRRKTYFLVINIEKKQIESVKEI